MDLLNESFESNPQDQFDREKKTWQDVRVHSQVKNALKKKSIETSDKEERCRCLKQAQSHFKATFEGFPKKGNDAADREKKHAVVSMSSYADFIQKSLRECIGEDSADTEADRYFTEAELLLKKWGLDFPSFEKAYEVHTYRALFLLRRRTPRLKPIGEIAMQKAVDHYACASGLPSRALTWTKLCPNFVHPIRESHQNL